LDERASQPQVELFNLFNSNAVLALNNNYSAGPAGWQRPTSILQGRPPEVRLQAHF
jgi:hypothetical protein